MKRILYFFYYLKKMNWNTFVKFTNHVKENEKMNKLTIYLSIIFDSLKYNISILEYFQFKSRLFII